MHFFQNKSFLVVLLYVSISNSFIAQSNIIDSLNNIISKINNDSLRANKLNSISSDFLKEENSILGYQFAIESSHISKQKKISSELAKSYRLIGLSYQSRSQFENAVPYYLKALNIYEKIKDNRGIARSFISLCDLNRIIKDFKKAEEYGKKSLLIFKSINDSVGIADANHCLGKLCIALNKFNEAEIYFNNFLEINLRLKNNAKCGMAYNYLAHVKEGQNKFTESFELYNNALSLFEKNGLNAGIAQTELDISNSLLKLNKNNQAVIFLKQALKHALESSEKPLINQVYQSSYLAFSKLGKFKDAYDFLLLHKLLSDSLGLNEISKKLSESQLTYQFEKKIEEKDQAQKLSTELKNIEIEKEKRIKNIFFTALICSMVLICCIIIFLLKLRKSKKIIIDQKIKVEEQKHLIEEKHKEITDSINYAERIQRSFLASNELLTQNLKNYFILFKPKDVVSGDFYWADILPNGNFILATADSTGHGVPGAIMSLLNITSLEKATEQYTNPSQILNHTRQTIISRLKRDGSADGGKDGMDCSLIVFDLKDKQLHIAAAHNPVWIVREKSLIEVKADKIPVGKHDRDQESFTLHKIDFKEGDIIYTLTDGFPDQFGGEKGKKFMNKNLKELLVNNSHLSMHEQKELLQKTFMDWKGTKDQVDDLTLIGIKL